VTWIVTQPALQRPITTQQYSLILVWTERA